MSNLLRKLRQSRKTLSTTEGDDDHPLVTPGAGLQLRGHRQRQSADFLQKRILPEEATKDHFTTIVPQGLPADIIGDETERIERHDVLTEPRGMKNEAARLPPFKPFKTISDEDNLHLLPGETGERARLNLLDTKAVTQKDIDDVREALERMKTLHPELYDKMKLPPPKPPSDLGKPEEPKQQEVPVKPPPKPNVPPPKQPESSSSYSYSSSSSSSESESEEEEEDEDDEAAEMYRRYMMMMMGGGGGAGYPGQGFGYGYGPGAGGPFPGGFGMPPPGGGYPGGFGPCQAPPVYNPCSQEVQFGSRVVKQEGEVKKTKKLKKPQGLDFDFLPHEDLATEVTFTIEPDDPNPLQYSVENGIMPIICCYMPASLALSQSQQPPAPTPTPAPQSSPIPSSGYPYPSSYYGNGTTPLPYGYSNYGSNNYNNYAYSSSSSYPSVHSQPRDNLPSPGNSSL